MRPLIRPTMIPQQVPRLAVVFLLAVIGLVVARRIFIPDTFGDIGPYRAAAIDSMFQLRASSNDNPKFVTP